MWKVSKIHFTLAGYVGWKYCTIFKFVELLLLVSNTYFYPLLMEMNYLIYFIDIWWFHITYVQQIVFLPLEGRNLTDSGTFSVPLLLLSEKDGPSKVSNLVRENCPCPPPSHYNPPHTQLPFICEIRFNSPMAPVDIHQVFNVQPSFSIQTGETKLFLMS